MSRPCGVPISAGGTSRRSTYPRRLANWSVAGTSCGGVFDFFWMLHIMDYDERENVNNLLLRGMTLLALVTALSGAWLLFFAFPRKRRKASAR